MLTEASADSGAREGGGEETRAGRRERVKEMTLDTHSVVM